MDERANEPASPIPSARFDDLDIDRPEDEEEWERRVISLAAARLAAERLRLERLGIIDGRGDLASRELPLTCSPSRTRHSDDACAPAHRHIPRARPVNSCLQLRSELRHVRGAVDRVVGVQLLKTLVEHRVQPGTVFGVRVVTHRKRPQRSALLLLADCVLGMRGPSPLTLPRTPR